MENTEYKEQKRNIQGNENSNYSILVKDMSPKDARMYLKTNKNDEIIMLMPHRRRMELEIRASEII